MRTYYLFEPAIELQAGLREKLSQLGWSEENSADTAEVIVVAPSEKDLSGLPIVFERLRSAHKQGLLLVLPMSASETVWSSASKIVPQIISDGAGSAEWAARMSSALELRHRYELAFAGERRLDLLRQSLEEVSMIDMRTGTYNRRFLVTRLREAIAASRRYQRPLSLCIFRVQGMDASSSLFDDEVSSFVESLTDRLESTKRSADVHAWIADNEFALLLPETPMEGAQIVAKRIEELVVIAARDHDLDFDALSCVALPEMSDAGAEEFIERARKLLDA